MTHSIDRFLLALLAGAGLAHVILFSPLPLVIQASAALVLNSGGRARYVGGSGTDALTFSYFVQAGENAADLEVSRSLCEAHGVAARTYALDVSAETQVVDVFDRR